MAKLHVESGELENLKKVADAALDAAKAKYKELGISIDVPSGLTGPDPKCLQCVSCSLGLHLLYLSNLSP